MRSTSPQNRARFALHVSILAACLLASAQEVRAQDPRPEAVAAASAAFREGQTAQLAGDYARAAEMFELADDSAPSPAALRSAIRNRRAASHAARAASLAAEAILRYPDDAETRALAEETITALAAGLGHLVLLCEPACTAAVDGRSAHDHAASRVELYVDPGAHSVVASWAGRDAVTESAEIGAGATVELTLTAPPAEPVSEPVDGDTVDESALMAARVPIDVPPRESSSGVTPIVFGSLVALTAVSGAVLIWSGIDVLGARDAYVAAPTRMGYEDGISRELRTNVLIGVTSALAVGTLVVAFFTDFGGAPSERTAGIDAFTLVPLENGTAVSVAGHF